VTSRLQRVAHWGRRLVENRVVFDRESSVFARAVRDGFDSVRSQDAENREHVLLAGPGAGSVGDQAMLEAFVANVDGPVTVIARRPSDIATLPTRLQARATLEYHPHLLYGLPHTARSAGRAFGLLLARARSFSVVGADVMDGKYWESVSARRFRVAKIAAQLGVDSRVLGFSWNAHPLPLPRRAMVDASTSAQLFSRDPVSAQRLRRDGATNVEEVADLAFLTEAVPLADEKLIAWISAQREAGRRLVSVNCNAILEELTRQVDVYADALSKEDPASIAYLAVPHDSRGATSDVDLSAHLVSQLTERGHSAFALDSVASPGEVMTIAAHSELVISGRMHFSILALASGTPAVTIGYQGKVAGLYEAMGLDCWVEAGPSARAELLELIPASLERHAELREAVRRALPAQKERAFKNLDGLAARGGSHP